MSDKFDEVKRREASQKRLRAENVRQTEAEAHRNTVSKLEAVWLAVKELHEKIDPNVSLDIYTRPKLGLLKKLSGRTIKAWEHYEGLHGESTIAYQQTRAGWVLDRAVRSTMRTNDDGRIRYSHFYDSVILTEDDKLWYRYGKALGGVGVYGAVVGNAVTRDGNIDHSGPINGDHFQSSIGRNNGIELFTSAIEELLT